MLPRRAHIKRESHAALSGTVFIFYIIFFILFRIYSSAQTAGL